MSQKIAIVSACVLGERCRYDGKTKKIDSVLDSLKGYKIVPFCPEAPLFGTPRERISVVEIDGENRIITDETKQDVTSLLEEQIHSFIKQNPKADKIILKSKSPSCGLETTPILNESREVLRYGNGVAAEIFSNFYTTNISDETF